MPDEMLDRLEAMIEGSVTPESVSAKLSAVHEADLNGDGTIEGNKETFRFVENTFGGSTVAPSDGQNLSVGVQQICDAASKGLGEQNIKIQESLQAMLSEVPLDRAQDVAFTKALAESVQYGSNMEQIVEFAKQRATSVFKEAFGSMEGQIPDKQINTIQTAMTNAYVAAARAQVEILQNNPDILQQAVELPDTSEITTMPYSDVCRALTGKAPGREL